MEQMANQLESYLFCDLTVEIIRIMDEIGSPNYITDMILVDLASDPCIVCICYPCFWNLTLKASKDRVGGLLTFSNPRPETSAHTTSSTLISMFNARE